MRVSRWLLVSVLSGSTLFADTGTTHRHQLRPPNKVELATEESVIPMQMVEGRPCVDLLLEGEGPFKFILDTGAGGTLLDSALARELELPIQGMKAAIGSPFGGTPIPADVVWVDRLVIGSATLSEFHVVAGDISKRIEGSAGVGRIFSPRMLAGLLVTLDFPKGVLVLRKGELPPADGVQVFENAPGDPLPGIPVVIGEERFTAHIDSGNSGGFDLPASLMTKLALWSPAVESGRIKVVDGERVTFTGRLKGKLAFGQQSVVDPEVRFREGGVANIGMGVLKDYVVTLDPANRRLRLDRAGS